MEILRYVVVIDVVFSKKDEVQREEVKLIEGASDDSDTCVHDVC